jgi:hypothetical protein
VIGNERSAAALNEYIPAIGEIKMGESNQTRLTDPTGCEGNYSGESVETLRRAIMDNLYYRQRCLLDDYQDICYMLLEKFQPLADNPKIRFCLKGGML